MALLREAPAMAAFPGFVSRRASSGREIGSEHVLSWALFLEILTTCSLIHIVMSEIQFHGEDKLFSN